jgi:phosphoribosyl 1,2-cyclic phosphate phosphodiesterase
MMEITFLGTGTSYGVPMVGCTCPVCTSPDPRNTRSRCSVFLKVGRPSGESPLAILIDTATEFRLQAIRARIRGIDAVLFTHAHADHIHGLDDIRPFTRERPIPVYGNEGTMGELRERFSYIFRETQIGGGKPKIDLKVVGGEPFQIDGVTVTPVPVKHGRLDILGWRIGRLAYLTDVSAIPEASFALLDGLDMLVLDAVQRRPMSTHFTVDEALAAARKTGAARVFLTHFSHEIDHAQIKKELPDWAAPSYDGLVVTLDD